MSHRRRHSSSAVLEAAPSSPPTGVISETNKAAAPAAATTRNNKAGFGEVAGSATAECAAVVCCCPCGLLDLAILAAVRLPAGICRRALMRRRMSRLRCRKQRPLATLLGRAAAVTGPVAVAPPPFSFDEDSVLYRRILVASSGEASGDVEEAAWLSPMMTTSMSPEVLRLEEEMWAQFYGAGFWRSPSQKDQ